MSLTFPELPINGNELLHCEFTNNTDLFKKLKFTFIEQECCYKYLLQLLDTDEIESVSSLEYKITNLKNIIKKEKKEQ
jgi:hypothetical protein